MIVTEKRKGTSHVGRTTYEMLFLCWICYNNQLKSLFTITYLLRIVNLQCMKSDEKNSKENGGAYVKKSTIYFMTALIQS